MSGLPLHVVDAFAAAPFRGNPAAVCVSDAPVPALWMQDVAAEMNLSETAFAWPEDDAWSLRWFTPTTEVELCGHATLATAHTLWDLGRLAADRPAVFRTRSGELRARREGGRVAMDFPALPPTSEPVPAGLADALGAAPREVARASVGLLVVLDDADAVRALRPEPAAIAALDPFAVLVTAAEAPGDDADVVSRFFAPNAGIPEDPVTGAAHCVLAPFWAPRLGRERLRCRQLSARGGEVEVTVAGTRVVLAGAAHTVVRGVLAPVP